MILESGMSVLCVDDKVRPRSAEAVAEFYPNWIKEGKKYIVRDVYHNDNICAGVLLEGVYNLDVFIPLLNRVQEAAFAEWRFAPAKQHLAKPEKNVNVSIGELEEELQVA